MKITKSFTKRSQCHSFFWHGEYELGVCESFINRFIKVKGDEQTVNITLSLKNPKKKGYRKILRSEDGVVRLNGERFSVCSTERIALDNAGVKVGDNFWIKVEKA